MTTSKQFHKLSFENNKLFKRLYRQIGKAIGDFNLIEDKDKIMVCMSGGKDSYTLLDLLMGMQKRAPIDFEIIAVNLNQQLPGYPKDLMPEYLERIGVKYHIETQDTWSIIERLIPEGKSICSLCSRLRRGILYTVAEQIGATKIALGHHRDDALETFFLNLFFGSKIKAMPAKLKTDNGQHIVIRPMIYIKEKDIERYTQTRNFPLVPKNLCGAKENPQRQKIKAMIQEWEKQFPGRIENVFSALSTIAPSHMLDRDLFNFTNLHPNPARSPNSDDELF